MFRSAADRTQEEFNPRVGLPAHEGYERFTATTVSALEIPTKLYIDIFAMLRAAKSEGDEHIKAALNDSGQVVRVTSQTFPAGVPRS